VVRVIDRIKVGVKIGVRVSIGVGVNIGVRPRVGVSPPNYYLTTHFNPNRNPGPNLNSYLTHCR
jgi:hypothetical protein